MKKYVSIFVCLALCFSMLFAFSSSAAEAEDLTFGGLIEQEIIDSLGHKYISSNLSNHLSAVEFVNEDDTRTIYTFDKPIKYVDKAGDVKRIDNTLVKAVGSNAWKNKANAFELAVQEDVTKGITLSYQGNAITAVPSLSLSRAGSYTQTKRADGKAIAFKDTQTDISYEATYDGYVTAVTIPAGKSPSFSVTLSGDIVAVTANGAEAAVTMTNGTVVQYNVYSTVEEWIEPSAFQAQVTRLSDTTYRLNYSAPMVLTTSAQIIISGEVSPASDETQTRNAGATIPTNVHWDAGVYSGNPSVNYGTSDRYLVGVDGTLGTCRAYVRFDLSALNGISYYRILSANYRIRELTGYHAQFQAEAYMVTGSWSENGITWTNKPAYNNEKLTTVNVDWQGDHTGDYPGYYDFYITQAVMAWKQGIPNYGIMLKSRVESSVSCRAFSSRQGNSTYLPRLSVTYVTDTTSMVNIGIEDNAYYYIKNKNSNLYLTATGTTDYSNVTQTTWTGANSQKWKVIPQGNGHYKLSPRSATGMVLDTYGGSDTDGANIQIMSPNTGLGQEFLFVRNWDGSYRIVTNLSGYVRGLRAQNDNTTNGGNVCHWMQTTNWMKSDDWTLEAVDKGFADVLTFVDTEDDNGYNLDTTQFAGPTVGALNNMGYPTVNTVDVSYSNAYNWLSYDSVWVFSGHGGNSSICFKKQGSVDPNVFTEDITATISNDHQLAVSNKPHNALAKLQLAVMASCYTGLDDENQNTNLVGMMYRKGAHFVIANSDYTSTVGDTWLQQFFIQCENGKTVYEAMNAADDYIYDEFPDDPIFGNANQRHCLGDNSLRLDR